MDGVAGGKQVVGIRGMSLIEVLVVIAVISLVMAILIPTANLVKDRAQRVRCTSNLRQVGLAIHLYAQDSGDKIPFGPEGRPVTGSNFYTVIGNVTSLLSLEDGAPVGLGLLLKSYLARQPMVLFCPGADQPSEARAQLARVGTGQAQCDYYYRHASVAMLTGRPEQFHIQLSNLGKNSKGGQIKALVTDVQFLAHPSLAPWDVKTRTSHRRLVSNCLYADGHVQICQNTDDRLTVDVGTRPHDALEKILGVFEVLDEYH